MFLQKAVNLFFPPDIRGKNMIDFSVPGSKIVD
jgi:hypothetical protein